MNRIISLIIFFIAVVNNMLAQDAHHIFDGNTDTGVHLRYSYLIGDDGERIFDGPYKRVWGWGDGNRCNEDSGNFKNNKQVGKWVWSRMPIIRSTLVKTTLSVTFNDYGVLHGPFSVVEQYRNGTVITRCAGNFSNGRIHGPYTETWDGSRVGKHGPQELKGQYYHGERCGKWIIPGWDYPVDCDDHTGATDNVGRERGYRTKFVNKSTGEFYNGYFYFSEHGRGIDYHLLDLDIDEALKKHLWGNLGQKVILRESAMLMESDYLSSKIVRDVLGDIVIPDNLGFTDNHNIEAECYLNKKGTLKVLDIYGDENKDLCNEIKRTLQSKIYKDRNNSVNSVIILNFSFSDIELRTNYDRRRRLKEWMKSEMKKLERNWEIQNWQDILAADDSCGIYVDNDNKNYDKIDYGPMFPGGRKGFFKYLKKMWPEDSIKVKLSIKDEPGALRYGDRGVCYLVSNDSPYCMKEWSIKYDECEILNSLLFKRAIVDGEYVDIDIVIDVDLKKIKIE